MLRLRQLLAIPVLLAATLAHAAEKWIDPTPAELSMTAEPKAPGAPAIYLFREEITVDDLHTYSVHARIKVFTEAGKDFGTVEIPFVHTSGGSSVSVTDLSARTIHPDGTIIPFTGKPYDKLIVKSNDSKTMSRVFSLPDVTPGSILEYRYNIRWDDNTFFSPDWYVQNELYTTRVHYMWKPTEHMLVSHDKGDTISTIAWTPILPHDAKVSNTKDATGRMTLELHCDDIPPMPKEEYMPPIASFSYRVLFYYTPYRTGDEFWTKEGKDWAHHKDKFIGPGSGLRSAAAEITASAATPEAKLRALYTAVGTIENTDYTRQHTKSEDKASGLNQIHTADDVWLHKRGSSNQINAVFLGLARAAGFKAYAISLTPRNRSIFFPRYLTTGQLDDDISAVQYDGPGSTPSGPNNSKEILLDPGVRFCPFGQLAWRHTLSGGLREVDGGAILSSTPPASYTQARTQRIGDLDMDEHGSVTGTVSMSYIGSPALHWREVYAQSDEAALRHDLTESMQHLLPGGMSVELTTIAALEQPDQPLVVHFKVSGPIGTAAGKRLLVPAALFESNTHAAFSQETRQQPIAFHFAYLDQDAVRIKLPPTLVVESMPDTTKANFEKFAVYGFTAQSQPAAFTTRRDYALGEVTFKVEEYPALRKFYGTMEAADQQNVVLKHKDAASLTPAAPPTSTVAAR